MSATAPAQKSIYVEESLTRAAHDGMGPLELGATDPFASGGADLFVEKIELPTDRLVTEALTEKTNGPTSTIERGEVPIPPVHEEMHEGLIADLAEDMGLSEAAATNGMTPGEIQQLGAELELAAEAMKADGIPRPAHRRTPLKDAEQEDAASVVSGSDGNEDLKQLRHIKDESEGVLVDEEDIDILDLESEHSQEFKEEAEKNANRLVNNIERLLDDDSLVFDEIEQLNADIDALLPELSKGGYSIKAAGNVVRVITIAQERLRKNLGDERPAIVTELERIPAATLRELYFSGADSEKPNYLKDAIVAESGINMHSRAFQLRMLERIYGTDVGGEDWTNDELAQRAEGSFISEFDKRIARLPEILDSGDLREVFNYNYGLQSEGVNILLDAGLAPEIATEYMKATAIRLRFDSNFGQIGSVMNVEKLRDELWQTMQKMYYLGPETLNRLNQTFGLENIWRYSALELDTLVALDRNDPDKIDWLREGDVTVVFEDLRNDYNGAMTEYNNYFKPSGRTIRFELTNPSDIYRRMAYLKKRGIKPATFVYGAHGEPGKTHAGEIKTKDHDTETVFAASAYFTSKESSYRSNEIAIQQTQFGRLVRDYMQPNRGIDCDPENVGRKQVILSTCSGDVSYDDGWDQYHSIAEAVASSLKEGDDNVDIYAGRDIISEYLSAPGKIMFKGKSDDRSATNKLVVERRGGLLGAEQKTYVRREKVNSVSVRRTA